MPTRACLAAAAALALSGGCILDDPLPSPVPSSSSQPVIGGAVTASDEDGAVVALTAGGDPFCSGTLVSPSVILTAAHCIDMGGDNTVHFGNNAYSGGKKVMVSRTKTHPAWNGTLGSNDIGLVLLAFAQDAALPVPLNASPADDHVGDPYRVVGFGVYAREPQMADGRKRQGTSSITGLQGGDVLTTGDDSIGICFGDSGGPGFLTLDGVEHVAGVHSFTSSSNCFPPMGDTRVDLHVESFLQPWLDDNDPACKANGVCARIGCSADPDCEPCGPEGTCTADCPLPDWDCPTQALGEVCQADTQCTTELCVYWQAEPGTRFCTRPCSGDGDCPGGMTCQDRPDVGQVCYYEGEPPGVLGAECASDAECGSQICDETEAACVRECDLSRNLICPADFECKTLDSTNYYCYSVASGGGGGCRAGGASDGAGALLALLGAALVTTSRRRRGACCRRRT